MRTLLLSLVLCVAAACGDGGDSELSDTEALLSSPTATGLVPADRVATRTAPWLVEGMLARHEPDGIWQAHLVVLYDNNGASLDHTQAYGVTGRAPVGTYREVEITLAECRSAMAPFATDGHYQFDADYVREHCELLTGPRRVWFDEAARQGAHRLYYDGVTASGAVVAGTFTVGGAMSVSP